MARRVGENYLPCMRSLSNALAVAAAAVLAFGVLDSADAARKKPRVKRDTGVIVTRDYDGTPIIMRGLPPRPRLGLVPGEEPARRAERPPARPRGSSTYVPPPVPAPNAPNSPPPAVMLQPPPQQPYVPPRIDSFGDRVTRCLHTYPLNAGVGNNPAEQGAYVRQCAN